MKRIYYTIIRISGDDWSIGLEMFNENSSDTDENLKRTISGNDIIVTYILTLLLPCGPTAITYSFCMTLTCFNYKCRTRRVKFIILINCLIYFTEWTDADGLDLFLHVECPTRNFKALKLLWRKIFYLFIFLTFASLSMSNNQIVQFYTQCIVFVG